MIVSIFIAILIGWAWGSGKWKPATMFIVLALMFTSGFFIGILTAISWAAALIGGVL